MGRKLQKISFQDVSLIVDRDILLSKYATQIITLSCNNSTKIDNLISILKEHCNSFQNMLSKEKSGPDRA